MGRAKSSDPEPLSSRVDKKLNKLQLFLYHTYKYWLSIKMSPNHGHFLKQNVAGKNPLCDSPPSQFQLQPPSCLALSLLPYLSIPVVRLFLSSKQSALFRAPD